MPRGGDDSGSSVGTSSSNRGSSGSSKGSSSGSKGSSSGSKGSQGNSGGLSSAGVGWGGGSKGPSFGSSSYKATTDFGREASKSQSSKGGGGDGGSKDRKGAMGISTTYEGLKQSTKASSDSAFKDFHVDTPANTQVMGGQLYTKNKAGNWVNSATGQEIGNTQLDRLAYYDRLKQEQVLSRGYDDMTAIKNFFTGLNPFVEEEDVTGPSPLGGWASYGGAVPGVEDTRGFFSKIADSFQKFGWGLQDSPLSTIANAVSNPLVTGIGAFTGTLPAIAAIRAASAVKDMATGVKTNVEGAMDLGATAIAATPLGSMLGPLRGVAEGTLKEGAKGAAKGVGATVGGTIGSEIGSSLGSMLASNPYGMAISTALGGALGSVGLGKLAGYSYDVAEKQQKVGRTESVSGSSVEKSMSSPLVASRETSEQLRTQSADPTRYIRETSMNLYNLPGYTMNGYGFPNTFIGVS